MYNNGFMTRLSLKQVVGDITARRPTQNEINIIK